VGLDVQEAAARFDRRRQAWLAEDLEGYLDCFTDDVELTVPGRAEPVRGRERYERLVQVSFAWARPVAFDVHHLAVADDAVLAEWSIAVERREDGVRVGWRGMSACGFRDGRIAWWREHWDPGQLSL
jgi:uncharacterized protein (TIGR02246 family)